MCLDAMLRTAGFAATKVFHETESERNARVCYHLRPDQGSLHSEILASATSGHGVREEYRQTIDRLRGRVAELEAQLSEQRAASPQVASTDAHPLRAWLGRVLGRDPS